MNDAIVNLEKYKNEMNVEIEFRVSVDKTIFEKCLRCLQQNYKEEVIHSIDYFDQQNNRKSDNLIIQKQKLYKSTLSFEDFQIKFCINTENPTNIKTYKNVFQREKKRHRFNDKYITYDLTLVNNNIYEIEVEINSIDSLHHTSKYIFDNSFKKLKKLLACSNF